MEVFEKKNALLLTEFDRYVVEHPRFAAKIPLNAQIVLQVEGDEQFNAWSRVLAARQHEEGQPVMYVRVGKLKPARSRLVSPVLEEQRS